jgi:hypothetical protein
LETQIQTAIDAEANDSNAQKAYKAFKGLTNSDADRTEAVFNELKSLVGLLKDTNITKDKLNPFKNDAAATSPSEKGKV